MLRSLAMLMLVMACSGCGHRQMQMSAAPPPPPPSPAGATNSAPSAGSAGDEQQPNQRLTPAHPPTPPMMEAPPPAHRSPPLAAALLPAPPQGTASVLPRKTALSAAAPQSNAGHANVSQASQGSSLQDTVHAWYQGLPMGAIRYRVPSQMTLNQQYTASAIIHPPTAPDTSNQDAVSGPHGSAVVKPLKIATFMRVVLDQNENPGTFKIEPAEGACKFVSMDADTEWDFGVTPVQGGTHKSLTFTADVIYSQDADPCSSASAPTMQLQSDRQDISIAEFTVGNERQKAEDTFWSDPMTWIKYVLPGGAVFTALAKLIQWWKNKKNKPQKTDAAG